MGTKYEKVLEKLIWARLEDRRHLDWQYEGEMVVATGNMKAYQWHHGTDKLYSIVKIWNWKFESDSHVGLVEDTKKQRKMVPLGWIYFCWNWKLKLKTL